MDLYVPLHLMAVLVDAYVLRLKHPMHLHGHQFWVLRSAGNSSLNLVDPVLRDVVSAGNSTDDEVTIRFKTDNPGPWILHW